MQFPALRVGNVLSKVNLLRLGKHLMVDRPAAGEHNTSQRTLWWPPSRNNNLESSLCQGYPAIFGMYYSRISSPMNNPPSLFSSPTFSHQVALFPFLCFCPCHFGRSSQAVPFVPPGLPGLGHLDHHLGHKLNVFEGSSDIAMICTSNYPYRMRLWWRWTNQEEQQWYTAYFYSISIL